MNSDDEFDFFERPDQPHELVVSSWHVPSQAPSFRELGASEQLGIVTAYLRHAANYFYVQAAEALSTPSYQVPARSNEQQGQRCAPEQEISGVHWRPISGDYVAVRFHRRLDEYRPLSLRDLGCASEIADQVAHLLVNTACVEPTMRASWDFRANDGMNLQYATLIAVAIQHVVWVTFRIVVSRWILQRWFLTAAKRENLRSKGNNNGSSQPAKSVHRLQLHWVEMRRYLYKCLRKTFPHDPLTLTVSSTTWQGISGGSAGTLRAWFCGLPQRAAAGGDESNSNSGSLLQWIVQHPIRRVLYEVASLHRVASRDTLAWWEGLFTASFACAEDVLRRASDCTLVSPPDDVDGSVVDDTTMSREQAQQQALHFFIKCIYSARAEDIALAALLIAVRTSPGVGKNVLASPEALSILEDALAPVVHIGTAKACVGMKAVCAWSWWSHRAAATVVTDCGLGGSVKRSREEDEEPPARAAHTAASLPSGGARCRLTAAKHHYHPTPVSSTVVGQAKRPAPSTVHRRGTVTCDVCGIVLSKQRFIIHYRTHASTVLSCAQKAVTASHRVDPQQRSEAFAMEMISLDEMIVRDCVPQGTMCHPSVLLDPAAATMGYGISPHHLLQQYHASKEQLRSTARPRLGAQEEMGVRTRFCDAELDSQWSTIVVDASHDAFYEPLVVEMIGGSVSLP